PASGPGLSGRLSATTGRLKASKRRGSAFALRITRRTCGVRRLMIRSSTVTPAIERSDLSPPPMRRARPPARTAPTVGAGSDVIASGLAAMAHAFLLHEFQALVEHDALGPRQSDETLAPDPPDQGEARLPRKLDAPRGETRPRYEDRNAHAHGLDDHFGCKAAGRVEDLVAGRNAMPVHVAGYLVDRVVAADILHIQQRFILPAKDGAVYRTGLEIERRNSVDRLRQPIEP